MIDPKWCSANTLKPGDIIFYYEMQWLGLILNEGTIVGYNRSIDKKISYYQESIVYRKSFANYRKSFANDNWALYTRKMFLDDIGNQNKIFIF